LTNEEVAVSRHNYDIIFKSLTETFADRTLKMFGIDTVPIVRAEKTELPRIEIDERRMDFVFYLADDSYLHLEFQTTSGVENLERFKLYDATLYQKRKKKIQTAVVYGAGVEGAPEALDHGSIKYRVQNIYMGRYDGDAIYRGLLVKVERQEGLEEIDQLNLIFLPLMKSSVDRSLRAIDAVEVAKKIKDERQQDFLIGSLVGITDKFIDREYVKKLMEVLRMTRVGRELYNEGIAEGRVEGKISTKKEDIKDYLDARFGFESLELQEKVDQITSLEVLDRLLKHLFAADSLEKARTIVEDAMKAQARKRPQ